MNTSFWRCVTTSPGTPAVPPAAGRWSGSIPEAGPRGPWPSPRPGTAPRSRQISSTAAPVRPRSTAGPCEVAPTPGSYDGRGHDDCPSAGDHARRPPARRPAAAGGGRRRLARRRPRHHERAARLVGGGRGAGRHRPGRPGGGATAAPARAGARRGPRAAPRTRCSATRCWPAPPTWSSCPPRRAGSWSCSPTSPTRPAERPAARPHPRGGGRLRRRGATTFAAAVAVTSALRRPTALVDLDPLGPGLDRVVGLEDRDGGRLGRAGLLPRPARVALAAVRAPRQGRAGRAHLGRRGRRRPGADRGARGALGRAAGPRPRGGGPAPVPGRGDPGGGHPLRRGARRGRADGRRGRRRGAGAGAAAAAHRPAGPGHPAGRHPRAAEQVAAALGVPVAGGGAAPAPARRARRARARPGAQPPVGPRPGVPVRARPRVPHEVAAARPRRFRPPCSTRCASSWPAPVPR